MDSTISVHEQIYEIVCLLGKGKGGYSYLVKKDNQYYVVKQIHHEPCDYYQFSNKLNSEIRDYHRLKELGIRMPTLLEVDEEKERILKEYIEGETIFEWVKQDKPLKDAKEQLKKMCEILYQNHLNIDYYPTNFIMQNGILFYIDYECNSYMEEWNFENWGYQYWEKSDAFLKVLNKDA